MNLTDSEFIRPLRLAENQFLQVLISEFTMHRKSGGIELRLGFTPETPTIWMRQAKDVLREKMPRFKTRASEFQTELDAFLLGNHGAKYEFKKSDFVFRYASGGVLPILRWRDEEYFALFYRDIFPIGWNIANGGSDTCDELFHPLDVMDRELREELVIFNPSKQKRYVFDSDFGKPLDRPEFAVARRIWQERFANQRRYRRLDMSSLEELAIPLQWMPGPDSVQVRMPDEPVHETRNCFLNINAEDFGIEIDNVAKLDLDDEAVLCDGEIIGDALVNAPVGLFKVATMFDKIQAESKFSPDCFFFDGQLYDGDQINRVMDKEFLPEIDKVRTKAEVTYYAAEKKKNACFGLCPVTERIIRRYKAIASVETKKPSETVDVFISFGGEDEKLAALVDDSLRAKNVRTFFSKESREIEWMNALNNALENAGCLVAVATSAENLKREWPRYEYTSFHAAIRNQVKPNGKLLAFIAGFDPVQLPLPLSGQKAVECDPRRPKPALNHLAEFIL